MNIAVCENDPADANIICHYLKQHFDKNGYLGNIHWFKSGEKLLRFFSPGMFDAVFLDIYMDGITGIETAKRMRKHDPDFALVYITISDSYAREAYSLRACGYVSKPIKTEELNDALKQCRTIFLKKARYIEVISERQPVKIPLVKIIYIEVFNKDILIHTTDGIIKTAAPLSELEVKLGKPFLRCHRAYLINMNYIAGFREQDIQMQTGDTVPMRQRNRMEIRTRYSDFLTNRLFEME